MSGFDASLKAKKSLGQNFLKDSEFFNEWINKAANQTPAFDFVLEIGPGKGALTFLIQGKFPHFFCVEKDHRLISYLDHELKQRTGNVQLVEADFMQWDWAAFIKNYAGESTQKFANGIVFANLPYYVASQIMILIFEEMPHITQGYLMFQQEMAKRIVTSAGNKEYGSLSLICQYIASNKIVKLLKPQDFVPAPKVSSAVVEFIRRTDRSANEEYYWFKKIVKTGFQFRRKTMRNNFKQFIKTENINPENQTLLETWLDWNRRPEDLSLEEWIDLSLRLKHLLIK